MRILVVGATGGTGREVVRYAISKQISVCAAARNPGTLDLPAVPVTVDFSKPGAASELVAAMRTSDAVISTIGPRSKDEGGIVTRGTKAIVESMKEAGVRRLEVISAAPVGSVISDERDPGDDWMTAKVMTPIVKRFFGYVYDDLAEMEDVVTSSGLDYTIVRPPRLVNKSKSREIRTDAHQNLPRGREISRADLAKYMVDNVDNSSTFGSIVRVAY